MGLTLSRSDVRAVRDAATAILSVLDYPELSDWAGRVMGSIRTLVSADRSVVAVPAVNWLAVFVGEEDVSAAQVAGSEGPYQHDHHQEAHRRALGVRTLTHNVLIRPEEIPTSIVWTDFSGRCRPSTPARIVVDAPGAPVPASIVFYRDTCTHEGFGSRARSILEMLVPAWECATAAVRQMRLRGAALIDQIDSLQAPLLLIGERLPNLHPNAAFEALCLNKEVRSEILARAQRLAQVLRAGASGQRARRFEPSPFEEVFSCGPRRYFLRAFTLGAAWGTGRDSHVLVRVTIDDPPPPPPEELRARFGLTARQAEVATLLARRLSNREIADALTISPHTARRHTERVFDVLHLRSRRDVRNALRMS